MRLHVQGLLQLQSAQSASSSSTPPPHRPATLPTDSLGSPLLGPADQALWEQALVLTLAPFLAGLPQAPPLPGMELLRVSLRNPHATGEKSPALGRTAGKAFDFDLKIHLLLKIRFQLQYS